MSMHGYAQRLLQESAAVVTTPAAGAPSHGRAAPQVASSGGNSAEPTSNPSPYVPFDVVNSQFSPTLIIILVILLSSFVFMAFFAMYVRRCTTEENFSRRSNTHGAARRDELPMVGSGVDPLYIESFPIVSYAAAKKKGCNECVVCLADFEGGEELKQLPKCKHVFHPGCIGSWLASHTTCPLCRRSLVNSDRWSVSLRWGGSSHGASLSARLNEGGSSHSRRGGDQTASPRLGRVGSSTGWQWWARGCNGDGSPRGGAAQGEASVDACELGSEPRGLPRSPLSSGLLPRGQQATPASPHGFQASNLMPGGWQASSLSSEVARNVAAEVAARVSMRSRQTEALKRLSRSNSTGHSLRKGAVSRAALQAPGGGGWATAGCMPLSPLHLHRSRSVGLDGPEDEQVMVDPAAATSEHSPLSGGCWTNLQSPHEPCPASTLAGPAPSAPLP